MRMSRPKAQQCLFAWEGRILELNYICSPPPALKAGACPAHETDSQSSLDQSRGAGDLTDEVESIHRVSFKSIPGAF